jgi:hypothetical protein
MDQYMNDDLFCYAAAVGDNDSGDIDRCMLDPESYVPKSVFPIFHMQRGVIDRAIDQCRSDFVPSLRRNSGDSKSKKQKCHNWNYEFMGCHLLSF